MALLARSLTIPKAQASQRQGVVCKAQTSRRALLGAVCLPAILYAPKAFALIPDDEDEDLLEKAKANRRARLEQQRGVTREFLNAEDLKDKTLTAKLVPLQRGVYKLAESGAELESGDLKAVSSTLSEGTWLADFTKAASTVSSADASTALSSGLSGFQSAVASGDLKASKKQYVTVVSAVKAWASSAGLEATLQGL